jgi:hypothetical protein
MEETGEYGEQELNHSDGEAEKFYRELKQRGISVCVGMEATGYSRWFERLLAELGFEAKIRGKNGEWNRRTICTIVHRSARLGANLKHYT